MRILILTAAIAALAACSQGANEEAGESADTAYEQSTTGTTNPGQGPMEEAGEQLDQSMQGGAGMSPATPPAETPPATPPATTP